MGTTGFTLRLVGAIVASVLLATVVTVALWMNDHRAHLSRAVAGHAGFVLTELRAALEARLNLGLALPELPQVDGLLEAAGRELPGLISVSVVDETGMIVFSTDAVEVGVVVPDLESPPPEPSAPSGIWQFPSDSGLVFGIGLTTSFDTSAGAVLVRVASEAVGAPVEDFALSLALKGTLVAVAVAMMAALVLLLLLRRPRRYLERLAADLEAVSRPPQTGRLPRPPPHPAVAAFSEAVRSRADTLDKGDQDVTRLDEMA